MATYPEAWSVELLRETAVGSWRSLGPRLSWALALAGRAKDRKGLQCSGYTTLGVVKPPSAKPKPQAPASEVEKGSEVLFPGEWRNPDRGTQAELASLGSHHNRYAEDRRSRQVSYELDGLTCSDAFTLMSQDAHPVVVGNFDVEATQSGRPPTYGSLLANDGFTDVTVEAFERMRVRVTLLLDDVNRTASPGYPWMLMERRNGELIDKYSSLLVETVMIRLRLLYVLSFAPTEELTPSKLLELGAVDPVRIFVKDEPHTALKAEQERWRLIFSVSIVDQLVERYLYSLQSKVMVTRGAHEMGTNLLGLGSDDSSLKFLHNAVTFGHTKGSRYSTDMSGFDWSVGLPEYSLDWALRRSWAVGTSSSDYVPDAPPSPIVEVMAVRHWALAHAVVVTSGGDLLDAEVPGAMKSGSYLTTTSNTNVRLLYAPRDIRVLAASDDAVELDSTGTRDPQEIVDWYASLGMRVKLCRTDPASTGTFEVLSRLYVEGSWKASMVGWKKSYYRLRQHGVGGKIIPSEFVLQFVHEMRYNASDLARCLNDLAAAEMLSEPVLELFRQPLQQLLDAFE